jgi:succinate dehydrogenase/fumarate reductase cytochrome b subunit
MSVLLVGSKYRLEGEGLQKSETGDKSIPEERMMEIPLRPVALIVELIILMAVIYSLFAGVQFALSDLGLNKKYQKFITWMMMIMGCLALVFFLAHLITFYPRLSHF